MGAKAAAIKRLDAIAARGWTASGKGVTRKYRHTSGWRVEHCGHPTALWPWGCYDPAGNIHTSGDTCRHGYAFLYVDDAIAHADRHIQETIDARRHACGCPFGAHHFFTCPAKAAE